MNRVSVGPGARVGQLAVGDNITQIYYEAPRVYADARFSLKAPPGDFAGRTREIELLVKQLEAGEDAMIVGLAGMGKSALAARAAGEVSARFPDAQIWIDLQGTSDTPLKPMDAMRQVILAFQPGADLSRAGEAEITAAYRTALNGKRALLVLDNAKDAAQVRPLLDAGCVALITSRASFALPGTTPLRLDVMGEEEARSFLLSLCPQLEEVLAADEIARLCGYLPLALRIAGSHLATRPNLRVERYLKDLSARRLELLKERGDEGLSVEAAFALSYAGMDRTLQALWRSLAVFPAPFEATPAGYVWDFKGTDEKIDDGKAEDTLGELLQVSLIEYDANVERYRWHDLLREFARGRWTAEESERAARRHSEFYLQVVRMANNQYLKGGPDTVRGLAVFESELGNIRAGRAWAAERIKEDEGAARLCAAYAGAGAYVIKLRLGVREQVQWLQEAVAAARALGDRHAEGGSLGDLAVAYSDMGQVRSALEFSEQALAIHRELGDRRGEGNALGNLANAYSDLGELRTAIQFYEQALAIDRELGARRYEAADLSNLGLAYSRMGEENRAIEFYEPALTIEREIGDRRAEASELSNLGLAFGNLGDLQRAIELHEQALAIYRELGDRRGEGVVLGNLGNTYRNLGEGSRAIELLEKALSIARAAGDPRNEAANLGNLASAYLQLGDPHKAIEFYEQALTVTREIGDRRAEGQVLANMGAAYEPLGDTARARELWEQALAVFVAMEHPDAQRVREWLAELGA